MIAMHLMTEITKVRLALLWQDGDPKEPERL